jgi:methyltransferase family protein
VVQKWERAGPCTAYAVSNDWERSLHAWFGLDVPCADAEVALGIYKEATGAMAASGLRLGPDAFVGWSDGDPALARAAYCLTVHGHCRRIVETGVGRGITTRMVLEALSRQDSGRLWSIELPPQLRSQLNDQIGCAVLPQLRSRWDLIWGPSRRRLPALLITLETVDLFIHDSRHTTRNTFFELSSVWSKVPRGGALLIDDVDLNDAVPTFLSSAGPHDVLIGRSEAANLRREGLFAVIHKL